MILSKNENLTEAFVQDLNNIGAKGVIYELPADNTYRIDTSEVKESILRLVDSLKNSTIKLILDVTPNYVTDEDALFKEAVNNDKARSSFVFTDKENNWISKVENGSAWHPISTQFILSQFGKNRYDLQLNDNIAKDKFKAVLKGLADLGVSGVRLINAPHFIISNNLTDEKPSGNNDLHTIHTDYNFFNHVHTTYQNGLGDLLSEFMTAFKNYTNNNGFVSVREIFKDPELLRNSAGDLSIELPIYTLLTKTLAGHDSSAGQDSLAEKNKVIQLERELTAVGQGFNKTTWVQWQYDTNIASDIGLSEYNTFIMLLPGVPVGKFEDFQIKTDNRTDYFKRLLEKRNNPSYMYGSFDVYTFNDSVIAYTR